MKCPYCGSEKILKGVVWTASNSRVVGLGERFLLHRMPNQVCSDICEECGTVVRTYIKDFDRLKKEGANWIQDKNAEE